MVLMTIFFFLQSAGPVPHDKIEFGLLFKYTHSAEVNIVVGCCAVLCCVAFVL